MSRTKIVLIAVIVLLIALLVACKDIRIPKRTMEQATILRLLIRSDLFSDVGGFYEKDFTLKSTSRTCMQSRPIYTHNGRQRAYDGEDSVRLDKRAEFQENFTPNRMVTL